MIYLASPYYHQDALIRQLRYSLAKRAAAKIMVAGDVVFSPIAHSHNIAPDLPSDLAHSHDFWMKQDLGILVFANYLYILDIPGAEQSKGIGEELAFAKANHISVEWISPEELFGETDPELIQLRRRFTAFGHVDQREPA